MTDTQARKPTGTVWDVETDVIVAGAGCAGLAAALGAIERGAETLILERTGGWGGASVQSGGLLYLGGGTALQQACGVNDSPEAMAAFLRAATGPGPNIEKIDIYCDRSVDHFDWLVSCGVPFKAELYDEPGWEPSGDQGLMYCGGENAYPFNTLSEPAPRGHVPQMTGKRTGVKGGGWMLVHHLAKMAGLRGSSINYDSSIERLVVDDSGIVTGVIARRYGTEQAIRARRGVVLATGGFVFNDDMLSEHAPHLLGRLKLGTDGDDGRSIRLAQGLGAAVARMSSAEAAISVDPRLLVRGLLVDGTGQRFINEDSYPGRIGQKAMTEHDGEIFLLLDEAGYDEDAARSFGLGLSWVGADAAELEAEMELPKGVLQATVDVFNSHAEAFGTDPAFHKDPKWVRPLSGPIGAIDLRLGEMTFATFTLGGLDTTIDGEVRHVDGHLIEGLYAAGRTTSGIPATGYVSGTSLGDATFFGRRAGAAAGLR